MVSSPLDLWKSSRFREVGALSSTTKLVCMSLWICQLNPLKNNIEQERKISIEGKLINQTWVIVLKALIKIKYSIIHAILRPCAEH